ncbi:MAG TPA: hypothetical protein VMU75_05540 [Acidimicrobiales bacterium]|nr:hypothetical protein [Acidimicrobiales bacterium]
MSAAFEPLSTQAEAGTEVAPAPPVTEVPAVAAGRSAPPSLAVLGVVTAAIAAWGGVVAYVGPTFGYSADGSGSWHWNLAHALLGLVPGAIGLVTGIAMISAGSRLALGIGRFSLGMLGLIALACGGWFAIGPLAWPVLLHARGYFVGASPLRTLANEVGYSFGPGLILAACGGFALGWSVRHRPAPVVTPVTGLGQSHRLHGASPAV